MQNQRTDANREHEPEARSQNAEIRKPCCAPPCIDWISSFVIVKSTRKTRIPPKKDKNQKCAMIKETSKKGKKMEPKINKGIGTNNREEKDK
jgi:hypothetical protein